MLAVIFARFRKNPRPKPPEFKAGGLTKAGGAALHLRRRARRFFSCRSLRWYPTENCRLPRPRKGDASMLRQFLVGGGVSICNIAAAAQSLTSNAPDSSPGKIDKSQLALSESKRLRDKAHLKFVAHNRV